MKNATLNIRVDEELKKQVENIAKSTGMSTSSIVRAYFRSIVRKGKIEIVEELVPTEYLKKVIKESEKDHKEGKTTKFSNKEDAINFLKTL